MRQTRDGGYGYIGNMTKYTLLNELLTPEDSEEYRKQLEKENPQAYNEYLEYEEKMNEISD